MELIKKLIRGEEGQGLVEYALIVGLIALVCVAAIGLAGGSVSNIWDAISNKLGDAETNVASAK